MYKCKCGGKEFKTTVYLAHDFLITPEGDYISDTCDGQALNEIGYNMVSCSECGEEVRDK